MSEKEHLLMEKWRPESSNVDIGEATWLELSDFSSNGQIRNFGIVV